MSSEIKVLKLFCNSRSDFDKGEPYLSTIKNMEREIRVVLNLIIRYYEKYPESEKISIEELKSFYDMQYPNSREKEVYFEIINDIFKQDISENVLKDLLEHIIERHYAAQMMMKLSPIVEGTSFGKLISLREDLDSFMSQMRNPPSRRGELISFSMSLKELVDTEINADGLTWLTERFNSVLGGLKRKTLGLIYAFVDNGKSSAGLACCAHFAKQLVGTNEKIIYAGNEESSARVSLRLTQAILKKTRREISADVDGAEAERSILGFDLVKVYDSITNISQIESLLSDIRPRVLFVDQGTKVSPNRSSENDVREAQYLFNWYRERAKLYDTSIICLAQAVGDAENKKWLRLSDIYGSRVSIQGELDYAIGIGRVMDDLAYENIRFINIPKNKLNDGEKAKFQVEFIKERCSFKEV